MKRIDFDALRKQVESLPSTYPVEVFVCLLFFAFMEVMIVMELSFEVRSGMGKSAFMLPLCFVGAFVLNRWTRARGVGRWAYYGVALAAVAVLVPAVRELIQQPEWVMAYPLALCALLLCGSGRDNRSMAGNAYRLLVSMAQGVLVGVCCLVASFIVMESYRLLFGVNSSYLSHVVNIAFGLVTPLAFLYFFAQSADAPAQPNRLANVVFNGIVPVSLVLYTLMLYAYFARVVALWELPEGGIAWMVIAFMAGWLLVAVYQELRPARLWSIPVRWIGFVSLPMLAMFWVGVLYRVGQYGITAPRYHLLAVGVVMTLCVLLLCVPRWRSYRCMVLFVAAAVVLTSFVPGITARAVARRSQQHHLQALAQHYGMLDEEGRFLQQQWPDSLTADHRDEIKSTYRYLAQADSTATRQQFGTLPELPCVEGRYEVQLYVRPELSGRFGTLVESEASARWDDSTLVFVVPDRLHLTFSMTSHKQRIEKLYRSGAEELPAELFAFDTPEGYTFVFDRIQVIDDEGRLSVEGLSPIIFKQP
ncbi:MAG: DUF4153 domain-containing protein [Bacteroidaceae bacterium]|nr:DUF4153 domain-containing protein [Bacteroidaceae bacterium]